MHSEKTLLIPPIGSRDGNWKPSFGSTAFFILPDGYEAKTSVNLSFGDEVLSNKEPTEVEPASVPKKSPTLKQKK